MLNLYFIYVVHYKHMGNVLTSLFLAAGIAALVYSTLGKRTGYGNSKNVWTLVGVSFGLTFVVCLIVFSTFINLAN